MDPSTSTPSTPSNPTKFPPLRRSTVLSCQFSSWYPTFRKHSPKATVLRPLEAEFVEWLESDGIYLPEGSESKSAITELSDDDDENEDEDEDEDDDGVDDESDTEMNGTVSTTSLEPHNRRRPRGTRRVRKRYSFPDLDREIRRVIEKYDGSVFPKLNWSSPQDAAWINPGPPLSCSTPAEVYLLLKSSDFVTHDLEEAFEGCEDGVGQEEEEGRGFQYELVLKKWFEMPRSQEYRCFVRDGRLIAISQRDSNFYDFLQSPTLQTELTLKLEDFFEDVVRPGFPESDYTFDVYFTRDNSRVFIVDFNPYAPRTEPLLFDYEELALLLLPPTSDDTTTTGTVGHPIFRVIGSPTEASQSAPRFSYNRYPAEVVTASGSMGMGMGMGAGDRSGSGIAEFAESWRGAVVDAIVDKRREGRGRPG